MNFTRVDPPISLKAYIECYWIVTDTNQSPITQKIVPDGFPEIIFHFGDSYQIDLSGKWRNQTKNLLAGQITRYFHLKNKGISDIFGIKFRPAAIRRIFDVNMAAIVDQVIPIEKINCEALQKFASVIRQASNHTERIKVCEEFISTLLSREKPKNVPELILDAIISGNGMVTITALCKEFNIHERTLERLFKKFIGVPPKFYCRIVRFSYIFQVINNNTLTWSEIGLESGFYDQPHFIKNFKLFTGEEPTKYIFDEQNLANFFLKR